jgi:hypothetical protein
MVATGKPNRAARRRAKGKGTRIGLSLADVTAQKARLRGSDDEGRRHPVADEQGHPQTYAASEPWIDAQFPTFHDTAPDGEPVTYHFHNPREVPAGHVRCHTCGHQSPPQCLSARGVCMDCQVGSMSDFMLANLPGSTSSVSLAKIRASRARCEDVTPGGM